MSDTKKEYHHDPVGNIQRNKAMQGCLRTPLPPPDIHELRAIQKRYQGRGQTNTESYKNLLEAIRVAEAKENL